MTVTSLPTDLPTTTDPANFDTRADALMVALPAVISEFNDAITALNLNDLKDVSTSSVLIGQGIKNFTVSASKSFQPGMFIVIADSALPTTNYMLCQVFSYNIGTGALVVTCLKYIGGGTISSWIISFDNPGQLFNGYLLSGSYALDTLTAIDFTSIPTWASEIVLCLTNASSSGANSFLVKLQAGDSTWVATGYSGVSELGATLQSFSIGFIIDNNSLATTFVTGVLKMWLTNVSTSDRWHVEGEFSMPSGPYVSKSVGSLLFPGRLKGVRFQATGGSTFDAGSVVLGYR